ncbi:MAG: hypothetical protein ACE5OS_03180 [Anaerolineae bacterium]
MATEIQVYAQFHRLRHQVGGVVEQEGECAFGTAIQQAPEVRRIQVPLAGAAQADETYGMAINA